MASGKWQNIVLIPVVWLVIFAFAWLVGEAYLRWHYFNLPMDAAHLPHPYLQNMLNPSVPIKEG